MIDLRSRLPVYVPLAVVAVVAAVGMIRVLMENWREGAALLGGAMLVAAALRVLLPSDRVGMLAVRSRAIDVLCYVGFGLVVLVLAVTITRIR